MYPNLNQDEELRIVCILFGARHKRFPSAKRLVRYRRRMVCILNKDCQEEDSCVTVQKAANRISESAAESTKLNCMLRMKEKIQLRERAYLLRGRNEVVSLSSAISSSLLSLVILTISSALVSSSCEFSLELFSLSLSRSNAISSWMLANCFVLSSELNAIRSFITSLCLL